MLPVKKIYVDSKGRTVDSKSTTNFAIDMAESISMPEDAVFVVADILIPHTWYFLSPNDNRKLYLAIYVDDMKDFVPNRTLTSVEIPPGNYDGTALASAIDNALKGPLGSALGQWIYTVTYDPLSEKITITPDKFATGKVPDGLGFIRNGFQLLSTVEINNTADLLAHYGKQETSKMNTVLGNTANPTPLISNASPYVSLRVDFMPKKYIFLKSPNLGSFMTLGTFGERTVIKKVPVTAGQGQLIVDDNRSAMDVLDCSKQSFKRLEFQLTDETGEELDLHHHDVSFSLIFSIQPKT